MRFSEAVSSSITKPTSDFRLDLGLQVIECYECKFSQFIHLPEFPTLLGKQLSKSNVHQPELTM